MLQIKNLTVTHKKDMRVILKNFSFTLNAGDKAVLIGEEGNGKSTLMKLIADERLADYAEYEGEILKNRMRLGYLPQELPLMERGKTVYEYFAEDEAFLELSPKELAEFGRLLGVTAEEFYSGQRLFTLSGGEKIKVQLLKLLMQRPDIYLLDEPSNDIDLETLNWLEKFIRESIQPVLFISHDETLIERTANVIIHIEQIKKKTAPRCTVARMPYTDYMKDRSGRFSHQARDAKKERSEYEKQQERYRRIYSRVEHQQASVTRQNPHGGQLLKKKMHAVKSIGKRLEREKENMTERPEQEESIRIYFHPDAAVPNGKIILDFAQDILCAGDKILARDVKLRMDGPQKVALIGKNGVGKSTFLKLAAQELLKRNDIRASYMPQLYEELLDLTCTPVDFLAETGDKEEKTRIRTWLGSMKYTQDEMEHAACELSGGQKAKLLLLKMSMDNSNVLILDEPTRNFSPLSGPVIRESLKAYPGAILSISHDRKYIREVCDIVYELRRDGFSRVWDVNEL